MAVRNQALNRFGRKWLKPIALVLLILPAVWITAQWVLWLTGNPSTLGFNPVQTTHHFLGETAIRILLVTLAIRPVKEITGYAPLMLLRRRVGLAAFFYALAHLLAYFGADLFFSLPALWADVLDRTYITFGMAALVLLIPLAVTSTNGMIKRLGAMRWRRLHQLVYLIAVIAVIHHFFAEKGAQLGPWVHGAILAVLLGYRFVQFLMKKRRRRAAAARPAPADTGPA